MKHYDTDENKGRIIFYFITDDLRKLAYRYDIINDEGRLYAMGDYKYTINELKEINKITYKHKLNSRQNYLANKN